MTYNQAKEAALRRAGYREGDMGLADAKACIAPAVAEGLLRARIFKQKRAVLPLQTEDGRQFVQLPADCAAPRELTAGGQRIAYTREESRLFCPAFTSEQTAQLQYEAPYGAFADEDTVPAEGLYLYMAAQLLAADAAAGESAAAKTAAQQAEDAFFASLQSGAEYFCEGWRQ